MYEVDYQISPYKVKIDRLDLLKKIVVILLKISYSFSRVLKGNNSAKKNPLKSLIKPPTLNIMEEEGPKKNWEKEGQFFMS